MTGWKARILRLTVFLPPESLAKGGEVQFEELIGTKPENVVNRASQQSEEGPFEAGRLLLQKQPGRIDVILAGFPKAEESEDPVATLGEFEVAFEALRSIAVKVFAKIGSSVRVALGTEMVRAAPSAEAAYKMLVGHMGSATFRLDGGQEFVYQMNRPRRTDLLGGLVINRLTRWNASSWQPVFVEFGGSARVLSGSPQVGAVITTDINTDAENSKPFAPESLILILDELRDLTVEIRDKGDIP